MLCALDGTRRLDSRGVVSLVYVAVARSLGRSSYAVLGAIGILATTTYFIQDGLAFVGVFVPFFDRRAGGADESGSRRSLPRRRASDHRSRALLGASGSAARRRPTDA